MLQLAADENFNNDIVRGLKRRDPLLDCSLQSAPGKRRRCDRPAPRGRVLARVKERWFGSSMPGRDHTGVCQTVKGGSTAVLAAHDVVDLEREAGVIFVDGRADLLFRLRFESSRSHV